MKHAVKMHIVGIAAAAGEEPRILASWERLTHVHGHGAHPDMAHPGDDERPDRIDDADNRHATATERTRFPL